MKLSWKIQFQITYSTKEQLNSLLILRKPITYCDQTDSRGLFHNLRKHDNSEVVSEAKQRSPKIDEEIPVPTEIPNGNILLRDFVKHRHLHNQHDRQVKRKEIPNETQSLYLLQLKETHHERQNPDRYNHNLPHKGT